MLRQAIQAKLQRFHATGDWKHPFWDRVVFRKVQQVAGGRVEGIVCGSAPVAKEAFDLMKVAFSAMGVEGYGMTETNATITRTMPDDPEGSGIAGLPHAFNHVKLVDVPGMGYSAEDKPHPRGELCVRGAHCITEYYKDPENTKKLIDEEGWLHTGDIASVDEAGRFRIVDRVKVRVADSEKLDVC